MERTDAELEPYDDAIEEEVVDEEALRAGRRRRLIALGVAAIAAAAVLAIPTTHTVDAKGRLAPQQWAYVRSEAPGVVRELRRHAGDRVARGEVIALLDFDEQRDALEAARLGLARARQQLADLDLRLEENRILLEGADAALEEAKRRMLAATKVQVSWITALEPASEPVLRGVRAFVDDARRELAIDRRSRAETKFRGAEARQAVRESMERYAERAGDVVDQVGDAAGDEARSALEFEIENVRFAFGLADRTMQELLMKRGLVEQDFLAPSALGELAHQLEREAMTLTQAFRSFASAARAHADARATRNAERRTAEEGRKLLANERERLLAEREGVESLVGQAELAVRSAERHQGKTAVRAPIDGQLLEISLAEQAPVMASAAVGVVEDPHRLVLKAHVAGGDLARVAEGQRARVVATRGSSPPRDGTVAWRVPVAGQEVRDQEWNVLIELAGDADHLEPGFEAHAAVEIGRRSVLRQLWSLVSDSAEVPEPRVAFVDDPTERRSAGPVRELALDGEAPLLAPVVAEPPAIAAEPPAAERIGGG
jgi:multidrug efflux pump subunit AcrA (membrane-fusion protein)